jgi:ribosome maturation protein SDO1
VVSEYTTARITIQGERFEILVKPDEALDYKLGKSVGISQVLVADVIFTDAGKGMKASTDKLMNAFQTTDTLSIAETILKRGELQITVEQRRKLIEEKRRRIIDVITKQCVDPTTGLPHPPTRIEQAMDQAHVSIDPFKDAEDQAQSVIDSLRAIIPIKIERIQLRVRIPADLASKAYGMVKTSSNILHEEWQADGSWVVMVEIPAGYHVSFLEKIGKLTRGAFQAEIVK